MKIFSPNKPSAARTPATAPKGKIKGGVPKKEMSDSAIREKVAANAEISEAAKMKAIQSKPKLGEGFMKSGDHLLKSDVQLNSPEDPVTAEKLKAVLSAGAFNFNPKERDVLAKILEN